MGKASRIISVSKTAGLIAGVIKTCHRHGGL